jgi:TonB-dependent SusC/RagA subfamily outer membrane receptor
MGMLRTARTGCGIAALVLAAAGAPGCAHAPATGSTPAAERADRTPPRPGTEPTGAVSVIGEREMREAPIRQLEQGLEGRVAGVQVLRSAGGGISIRIRGHSTITGSSEPLYVVDGMPVHVTPGRGLDWLNPLDIARIEVLKDASATSLYGMRGANGVVLITTRRGGR